jgi:hypothetical protein
MVEACTALPNKNPESRRRPNLKGSWGGGHKLLRSEDKFSRRALSFDRDTRLR